MINISNEIKTLYPETRIAYLCAEGLNSVKEIPANFKNFQNLQDLYLDGNQIEYFNYDSIYLENISSISLYNNPIKNIPKEVYEQRGDISISLKSFFFRL